MHSMLNDHVSLKRDVAPKDCTDQGPQPLATNQTRKAQVARRTIPKGLQHPMLKADAPSPKTVETSIRKLQPGNSQNLAILRRRGIPLKSSAVPPTTPYSGIEVPTDS